MTKEKTVLEWLQEAKEQGYEWADKAIYNAISYDKAKAEEQIEPNLSEAVLAAFQWANSKEGASFWGDIWKSLL